jgi:hypothetical protein
MKLKHTEIKQVRLEQIQAQNNQCAFCKQHFLPDDRIHLDHCHASGFVRGAVHANCNSAIGKFENTCKRFKISPEVFVDNILEYKDKELPYIHPTYYTPEEKIQRTKDKAARKRKK